MTLKEVLRQASYLATPSSQEVAALTLASKAVVDKLESALKKKKFDAKVILGGSFSRGTWLPGSTDVDCFVAFNRSEYKEWSKNLADLLEPAIDLAFTYFKRLHGSRDYFQVEYDNYVFEFIPVLSVRKAKQAMNITDVSPLHVKWVKKKTFLSKSKNSIRLTKLFFKSAGVYGAESYIKGFSGYVCELLTIHYGSFIKLAKAAQNWNKPVYIDPENHYASKQKALRLLNAAKTQSPLILVDPVQEDRNAAASLDNKKFNRIIKRFADFLANPHIDFFCEKLVTPEELMQKGSESRIILLSAAPTSDKKDIAGAKLLKQFGKIAAEFKDNEFIILEKGWQWRGLNTDALFWFFLPRKSLSATKKHYGPPFNSPKARVNGFFEKYGDRIKKDEIRYYVILKREFTEPEDLVRVLLKDKEFKNIKFLK